MANTNTILAAVVNFDAYQADTFKIFIDFFDDNGTPFDLSQWDTLQMQVRNYPRAAGVLVGLSLGSGLTISNTNRLTIAMTSEQMDITGQVVVYDIEGTNATEKRTILKGNILFQQDVTKI